MTKPPEYEPYQVDENATEDPPSWRDQMGPWQEKQAEILRAYYNQRIHFRWRVFQTVGGVLIGVVVLAAVGFGGWKVHQYSTHQYYIGFSTWAANCEGAGGRVAGNYSNASSQTCVFPGGSQLTRTAST